ncbi:MAG: hypothetical protein GC168_16075 [Candidatus Hydrogenedens sp.]|nr:hypothetical protein [Candidatus Hydrogenedens sp.]
MASLPKNAKSDYMNESELRALNRVCDCFMPRNGEHPSFSDLGCIQHIDLFLPYVPEPDLKDLKMLLGMLAVLPGFVTTFVVWASQKGQGWFEPLGTLMRKLDYGFRSIALALYYSGLASDEYAGKTPLEIIGFEVSAVHCDGRVENPYVRA